MNIFYRSVKTMDNRFPKYIKVLVRKLEFLSIPNLGMLLAGLGVLGFLGRMAPNVPMEQFVFDPNLFLAGEWWRIVTFPVVEVPTGPIWFLFYVFYVYFIASGLEEGWGVAPLTVFVLMGYLTSIASLFYVGHYTPGVWQYFIENLTFAYGTLFPEMTFHIFGILPVKAKWIAIIYGALTLFRFVFASLTGKVFLLIVFFPYLFFFLPLLISSGRSYLNTRKRRKRYDEGMWK